jgi:ketosteroid isomerase-like protein
MKHLKIFALLLAVLTLVGCNQGTTDPAETLDKEAIARQLEENWNEFMVAFMQGDIDRAMSFLTEDYINMPAAKWTQDYEGSKELFLGMMDNNYIPTNTYTQGEVFVHPDMAYEFGEIYMVLVSKTSGDTIINNPRTLTVWKKMDDGSWKLHRWMGQD